MPREPTPPSAVDIASADIAVIKELYLQGRYRAAYDHGRAFGPLRAWAGPAGRLIAGRLAMQLGAPRLGRQLHILAYRESPAYPESVYYHARYRLERFGPFAGWQFQRAHTDWDEASPELRGDWLALQAFTSARLRDFDRAEKFLGQSEAMAPNRPWHFVERSSVLEFQEKLDDALAAARQSLDLQTWFRPGVQAIGHLLARTGRTAEACEFLTGAAGQLESGLVLAQLAAVQLDLGRTEDARRSVERYADLSPLLEPDMLDWLAARRADVAYFLGEMPEAEAQARLVEDDDDAFYPAFAERLKERAPARATRVILPVDSGYDRTPPTVPQLLGRYWNRPLELPPTEPGGALDGIPDSAERRGYERLGWSTREFSPTPEVVGELIGREIPFQLTLVETGFGQTRLVIGADDTRGSLYFAETLERKPVEAPLAAMRERFRSTGPRCLVAVPPGEEHELDGIAFPDAHELDALHRMQSHLAEHRAEPARAELDSILADFPDSLWAKLAQLAWAKSAQHPVLLLESAERLLIDYPHDATFAMVKANALRELGLIAQRTAFLRIEGGRCEADPILMQSLAQVLLADPREQDEAERLLRLSLKMRPHSAAGYFLLGAQWWEHQRFAEAVELNRFACCLDEREEQFADAYLRVARATGQISDAVRLLQRRATRAEIPAAAAVRSFHAALVERGEPEFARTALDKAIEKLETLEPATAPVGDEPAPKAILAELRIFRAEQLANRGEFAEAELELAEARLGAPRKLWLKASARMHRTKPSYRAALVDLREYDAHDPLNPDVHRLIVGLLADTDGKAAARGYLAERAGRFPHFYPLLKLRAEWLTGERDDSAIRAIDDLLAACPRDAWAHRQLALLRGERREIDAALLAAQTAAEFEPEHPSQYAVLANVTRRADRGDEACEIFRQGLAKSVDHELAIVELVQTARGSKEKKAALRYIAEQLHAQPTNGDGLLAYRDQMLPLIDEPEELESLLAELEGFLDERPDLWQAWSIVIQQLIMMHREQEATSLAKEATARFPLLSRLWMDLAEACGRNGATEERIEALRQAVKGTPGWTPPAKDLADALVDAEERDEALAVLATNRAKAALDPLAHGFLAEHLWESDRGEEALTAAERAVRHEPGYDWAWGAVSNWGERLDRPDAALALARDLARDRAGDPRVFLKLARFLNKYDQTPEALEVLDRAAALEPTNPEPYDLKAERLADVGRFEEALATLQPAPLLDNLPLVLQGRAAWVEARRGNYGAAIPMMQALVSIDPGYYWGWQQLAEWFNDTGKAEAYLEAAEEMCRLRPEHPTPLTMRGEAKLLGGARDEGKGDLREALRLHPGYSPAAAILFDACLADGELKEARTALAVLQEHLAGPEGLIKQLIYAVRTDDRALGERTFRDIAFTPGEGSPTLLQMAMAEMRRGGWEDLAIETLSTAWRSGEEFNPWAAIFWLDTAAAEIEAIGDRVAACDAAIREYPNFLPAHDRKAEQLARAGQFDEARDACDAPQLHPKPLTLRGRLAWIEAQRGDRAKAIDSIIECLKEDPDYTWGWRQLAHWHDDLGQHKECLEAANHLVRLAPVDPYAYGIRGEAKRILGDHRGARDDYEQAFQLDPNFGAAGHQLMSEQLATDDLGGAQRTLATLREHADGPLLKLRAVQLAVRQRNLAEARALMRGLIEDDGIPKSLLRDSAREFDEQGWAAEIDDELSKALDRPGTSPGAAGIWAERLLAAGQPWKVGDRLKQIVGRNPDAAREATLVLAGALNTLGQHETATATVQRFADLLRETDDGWARAGAVLVQAKQYGLGVAWLQDWTKRAESEAWMLRALGDAHRALGQDAEAEVALRAAREKAPDDLPPDMSAWLAIIEAASGNTEAANGFLDAIDPLGLPDGTKLLLAMAESLVMVQQAAPDAKAKAFREAREDLKAAAGACPAADVPIGAARWFLKVARRLAADGGGLAARAWAMWVGVRPLVREG